MVKIKFLNKKNLSVESDSVIKTNIPEIILNNSDIRITEISSNQKQLFKAKSLFASYRKILLKFTQTSYTKLVLILSL